MLRGEIRLADLDPVRGSEAAKRRPVLVVSNDVANRSAVRRGRGVVTVMPLTSNTERIFAFQAMLPADRTGLSLDSKAQAEQVRAIDVQRLGGVIGRVPAALLDEVDDALRLHLGL